MHLSKVARSVVTDLSALLLTVGLSIFATLHSHIPAALSFAQLVAIELLVLAWPVAYFTRSKGSPKVHHDQKSAAYMEIAVFAVLAAALSYGNYLLFYSRHSIDPAYMDHANPLHLQATTLTLTTIALCELINTLFVSIEGKKHAFRVASFDPELVKRLAVSGVILLSLIYLPFSHTVLNTKSLGFGDWLATLFCAATYAAFRLLQRHTTKHSRHAVIKLHKEINGPGK
jgi:magnesium-transporting ATPase (P-type)